MAAPRVSLVSEEFHKGTHDGVAPSRWPRRQSGPTAGGSRLWPTTTTTTTTTTTFLSLAPLPIPPTPPGAALNLN
ncbi:hypothetical protein E2C01_041862 [Portunus trituberculatus]|uniref:Uncharacterized protein n=1 Tax=Portunus trituberculatus TaxID=210409 RepID=A0A5B7FRI3_PORTR|nr:hypothetical protein [Portunus trituberculatus]